MSEIVDIFDMSYEGAGVGKIGGQVVFVPKTLPGEKVEVEIVRITKSFMIGKLLKVITPSEWRVEPNCQYFQVCGGCDFQHCERHLEQDIKTKILKQELAKIGFGGEISFVAGERRFLYRNKIKFEVKDGKLGYFKPKTHDFFEVKTCPIAEKEINLSIEKIKEFLKSNQNNLPNLKNVYIKRINNGNIDNEKMVAICFLFDKKSKKMMKNINNLYILSDFFVFFAFGDVLESNDVIIERQSPKQIDSEFNDKLEKFYYENKRKTNNTFHDVNETKSLVEKIDDFEVEVDISAFKQINDEVAKMLYDYICKNTAGKKVINAYSGQGVLTYLISKTANMVYGIELQKQAHNSAEKLKALVEASCTKCGSIENICGRVEDEIGKIIKSDRIDCVVLDPARDGCKKEVMMAICESNIGGVIYVSCNFSTLVRDLKLLQNYYDIETVKIFDMFPCTMNLETVVMLKRKLEG